MNVWGLPLFRALSHCIGGEKLVLRKGLQNASAVMKPWKPQYRRSGAVGFKLGMMSHYDQWGRRHPITVLRLDGCQVVRSFPLGGVVIQEVGAGAKSTKQLHAAQRRLFEQCDMEPKKCLRGFSVSPGAVLPSGTPIYAAHFVPGQLVDVQSQSIGKGFQGAMVRWGFKGLPASHGVSLAHRHIGATGCRSDPGRVFKGKKMAGRMGGQGVTHKKLLVFKIDNALNCIFVRGCVGGHDNTVVKITDSKENPIFAANPPPYPTFIPEAGKELPRVMLAPDAPNDSLEIKVAG